MSDPELSDAGARLPPGSKLEKQLRTEIVKCFKDGTELSITVNGIRKAAEKALGLEEGFYAGHSKWKSQSKNIINDETDKQAVAMSSPVAAPHESPEKVPTRSIAVEPSKLSKPQKRSSPEHGGRPKKRTKNSKVRSDSEDDLSPSPADMDEDDLESTPEVKPEVKGRPKAAPKKRTTIKKAANGSIQKLKDDSESALSPSVDMESDPEEDEEKETKVLAEARDSESELSVLLDEEPKPKKVRKSSEPVEKASKKAKTLKPKADVDVDPDAEEIKRLQGWLVKCGIRKLWGKELKPYETPKAKIKHLKDMLSDAGMTGRYSQEKATQVKEARELAADIEAVKEGAERWGKGNEDSDDDGGNKPKRRVVRGAKNYAFLSSDGEETD